MSQDDRHQTDQYVSEFAKIGIKRQEVEQKREDQGWDLKFQNHVDYVINAQNDMTRNFKLSQRLFDHVGKFRR